MPERRTVQRAALLALLCLVPAIAVRAQPPGAVLDADAVVRHLELSGHVEGGFFRRTYAADGRQMISTGGGERYLMTSIFYLLTGQSPVGHFHRNRSDIVHYFHLGDPIDYFMLHPDGTLETVTMGPDLAAGQRLQLTVHGGIWKASRVRQGAHGYGLISEAVAPGFDYADMTLGDRAQLNAEFPLHRQLIQALTRSADADNRKTTSNPD